MFSVYGPGQSFSNPYQGVLGIFSGNLLRGEPITIFGDGEQTRDFVYVDDVVEGWVRALATPASRGRIINLGSGRSRSINELGNLRHRRLRGAASTRDRARPARPGEQRSVCADIGLAKAPRLGADDAVRDRIGQDRAVGSVRILRCRAASSGDAQ